MAIDDINGTRAKPLYKGVAKEIIGNKDIKGASPPLERVSLFAIKQFFFSINQENTTY
jgi:hypothetical protein